MKERKKESGMDSAVGAYALISQLGLTITIPIILGAAAGRWLDEKFGTGMVFLVILLCLGIAGGVTGAYHLTVSVTKKKNK